METHKIYNLKRGTIFTLLGSYKPFIESLSPNIINQQEALENQFRGMTDIPFTYQDYEKAQKELVAFVNSILTEKDKTFLMSFEEGNPHWENSEYNDFRHFPSVQRKLLNVNKLKTQNYKKYRQEVNRLKKYFRERCLLRYTQK